MTAYPADALSVAVAAAHDIHTFPRCHYGLKDLHSVRGIDVTVFSGPACGVVLDIHADVASAVHLVEVPR